MSEFKVGDKVRRTSGFYRGMSVGDISIVTKGEAYGTVGLKGYTGLHDTDNLELVKEKTMDNLQIGDTVVRGDDWCNESFTVEGKLGRVYIGFDEDEIAYLHTAKELEEQEFKLPSDVLEVTVAEVSKKFGKTVKIVEDK